MSRMKNYYEFAQLLHDMTAQALIDMLRTETDDYKRNLIQWELDDRAKT